MLPPPRGRFVEFKAQSLRTSPLHTRSRNTEVLRRRLDAGGVLGTPGADGGIVNTLGPPKGLAFGLGAFQAGKLAGLEVFPFQLRHRGKHVSMSFPAGVARSKPSRIETTDTPLAFRASTVQSTSMVLRPSRSIAATITTSPSRT